jgi:hypothetical protein
MKTYLENLDILLKDLTQTDSTLLWLENSRYYNVKSAKLKAKTLILKLSDDTVKLIPFEKYTPTKVGLQFWSQNRPGVLYRWEQVKAPIYEERVDEMKKSLGTQNR